MRGGSVCQCDAMLMIAYHAHTGGNQASTWVPAVASAVVVVLVSLFSLIFTAKAQAKATTREDAIRGEERHLASVREFSSYRRSQYELVLERLDEVEDSLRATPGADFGPAIREPLILLLRAIELLPAGPQTDTLHVAHRLCRNVTFLPTEFAGGPRAVVFGALGTARTVASAVIRGEEPQAPVRYLNLLDEIAGEWEGASRGGGSSSPAFELETMLQIGNRLPEGTEVSAARTEGGDFFEYWERAGRP